MKIGRCFRPCLRQVCFTYSHLRGRLLAKRELCQAYVGFVKPPTSCGVRTHAELPPVDLKSPPLTTRANWLFFLTHRIRSRIECFFLPPKISTIGSLQRAEHPQIIVAESLGFSGSPALLFDLLRFSSGSLWIQSLGFSGLSGHPESAFLSAVSLASRFTVAKHKKLTISVDLGPKQIQTIKNNKQKKSGICKM